MTASIFVCLNTPGSNKLRSNPIGYHRGPDCWEWVGSRDKAGYGQIARKRRLYRAHRFVYEQHKGPIPNGLDLDHLCRNRGCVNPAHLEPVTRRENVLRGQGLPAANAAKTHCSKGHPFIDGNLVANSLRHGWRLCRTCDNVNERRLRRERKARSLAR
jgi:hypothetical protein